MSFFSTDELAFGLDISDHFLRLIQLKRFGKKIKIQLFNEVKLPPQTVVSGKVVNSQYFVQALKQLTGTKRGLGGLSNEAVVALPQAGTFLKTLEIAANNEEELLPKIEELLPQSLPLALEEIYYDWQTIKSQEGVYTILVGAAPRALVDSYSSALNSLGILPVVFEIEAIAIARLLVERAGDTRPQIIADLGANRSSLILCEGSDVKFNVTLALSGKQIDQYIAESLELDLGKAEQAKIICGLSQDKCHGAVLELLVPLIDELATQILHAVDFYQNNFSSPGLIEQIQLCGGLSGLTGLSREIKNRLNTPVVSAEPFKNIVNPDPHYFTAEKSQSFVPAIGLALRGLSPKTFYDHNQA
ncbi:MAG: type IV pilus assembly protein PilM [Patescibacteria group bacterium]|jgi:type IV pilus assembly protein PilM